MSIFAGESRASMRRRYLDAWRKFCAREALGSLEAQLAAVIAEHPEYVAWLESGDEALSAAVTSPGSPAAVVAHYRTLGLLVEAGGPVA